MKQHIKPELIKLYYIILLPQVAHVVYCVVIAILLIAEPTTTGANQNLKIFLGIDREWICILFVASGISGGLTVAYPKYFRLFKYIAVALQFFYAVLILITTIMRNASFITAWHWWMVGAFDYLALREWRQLYVSED